jgi:hypothetical protein
MFASKTELSARYAQYPTNRLIGILFEKDQYEPEAVKIAHLELLQRKVNLGDAIDQYLDQKETDRLNAEKAAAAQLSLFEKVLFFFLWLAPLFRALMLNYKEDGMEEKIRQSHFFSRLGFCSFIVTGVLAILIDLSTFQSVALLLILFLLTRYADKKRVHPLR